MYQENSRKRVESSYIDGYILKRLICRHQIWSFSFLDFTLWGLLRAIAVICMDSILTILTDESRGLLLRLRAMLEENKQTQVAKLVQSTHRPNAQYGL